MIDLDPRQLQIVKNILRAHALEYPIYAFGSRVRGNAKKFSDLDLIIRSDRSLGLERMGELRWAFSDSDLPIKVDVLDWSEVNESFRRLIEKDWERVFP